MAHLVTAKSILEHTYKYAPNGVKRAYGIAQAATVPVTLFNSAVRSLSETAFLVSNPAAAAYAVQTALPALLVDSSKRFGRVFYKDPRTGKLFSKSARMIQAESIFRAMDATTSETIAALYTGEIHGAVTQGTFLFNGQHVWTTFVQNVATNSFRKMALDYANKKGLYKSGIMRKQMESTLKYYGIEPEQLHAWASEGMPNTGAIADTIRKGTLAYLHDSTVSPVPMRLGQWNANPYLAPVRALTTSMTYLGNTLMKKYITDFRRQWVHNGAGGVMTQLPFTAASIGMLIYLSMLSEDLIQKAYRGPQAKTTMDNYSRANSDRKKEFIIRQMDRSGMFGRAEQIIYGVAEGFKYGEGFESAAGPVPGALANLVRGTTLSVTQGASRKPIYRELSRISPLPPAQLESLVTGKTTKRIVDDRVNWWIRNFGKGGKSSNSKFKW